MVDDSIATLLSKEVPFRFLSADIPIRFLYYVSDLPLDRTAGLSAHLSSIEGIPPLYAITRQIISDIFNQERARI